MTRQVGQAKVYAAKKAWTVAEEFVFADDAVKGRSLANAGQDSFRLMNAAEVRPPWFEILVMGEESRLGLERIKTEYHPQTLAEAGVRIFFYLADQEARMDDATSTLRGTLRLYAAHM